MLSTIKIITTIPDDRRLVIDLPDDAPVGEVEVIINAKPTAEVSPPLSKREEARAKLLAAGSLVTYFDIPDDARQLTQEERRQLGQMPPHARPSEELIDEDRGEW